MARVCSNPGCGAVSADDGAAFCSRCGAPVGPPFAATQFNPGYAPMAAPPPWSSVPPAAPRQSYAGVIVAVVAITVVAGGGAAFALLRLSPAPIEPAPGSAPGTTAQQEQRVAPTPALQPAPTPPPNVPPPGAPSTSGFLSSVHYHSPAGVDLHPGDLDAADGRCASLTGAMITLEFAGGDQFVSDGNPQGTDLQLSVGASGAGPYDVELGVGHGRFVPVMNDLRGNQALDLDRLGVRVGRFVRISTRRTGATVCLDAVLVEHRVASDGALAPP
jgi:hypothetical protein